MSITVKQTVAEPLIAGQTTEIPTEVAATLTSSTGYNPTITWAQYRLGLRNTVSAVDGFIVNSNASREVSLALDPLPDTSTVKIRLISLNLRAGATQISCSIPVDLPELTYAVLNATAPVVGDGVVGFNEQCDDSNNVGGDGCSADGQFEPAQNLEVVSSGQTGNFVTPDVGTSFWFVEGPFNNLSLSHWSESAGAVQTGVGPVTNTSGALTSVAPGEVVVATNTSPTGYLRYDLSDGSTNPAPPPQAVLADGTSVYEIDETVDGVDLNGDGDALDGHPAPEARTGVLHAEAPDGTVTNLGVTGSIEKVVASGVFLKLREYTQAPNTLDTCFDGDFYTCVLATYDAAADLNSDGDVDDSFLYFWSPASGLVFAQPSQTMTVEAEVASGGYLVRLQPGGLAHWQPGANFGTLENFTPIAAGQTSPQLLSGDTFVFANSFSNGFLKTWSPATGLVGTSVPTGPPVRLGTGGGVVWLRTWESNVGTDLNGDGDQLDGVAQFWTPAGGLQNTGVAVDHEPVWIGGSSFALSVSEQRQAADLNGDGDRAEVVVFTFDVSTGLTNLGIATSFSAPLNLEGDVAFGFEADEESDNTDHNGDGVIGGRVIVAVRPQ